MDDAEKQRNREIADNEAERQITGDIRVSVWTIAFAVIIGIIAVAIVWAWLSR
jgi:hypothetical protein